MAHLQNLSSAGHKETPETRGICVDMSTIYVDMLLCLLCRSRNFFVPSGNLT